MTRRTGAGAANRRSRRESLVAQTRQLVHAIQNDDEALLERLLSLSRSRRVLAPLAFTAGAFMMLFEGIRLLLANWRLLLIQTPPALWIWLAMLDLKLHVLHGRSLNVVRGPILIPIGLVIVALTAGAFFLNAVFAFAITGPRPPIISRAYETARAHLAPILAWGAAVGALLAIATTVSPRWGPPWFTLTLGIVVGVMMLCYVAVPSRIVGVKPVQSRRDKLTASIVGSVLGVAVCTPPYMLGRIGILMLGSRLLLIPGILLIVFGFTLQAGATGAVRAIKMSAALAAGTALPGPTAEAARTCDRTR